MVGLLLALGAAWWWFILRRVWLSRSAAVPLDALGALAIQITLIASLWTWVTGRWSVFDVAVPPAVLVLEIIGSHSKRDAMLLQNGGSIALGTMVGALCVVPLLLSRSLRRWSLLPFAVGALAVTLLGAERRSAQRMTTEASRLGATCLARHSLWASLGFWGAEFQFDLHAVALVDGRWLAWSYHDDGFYPLLDGPASPVSSARGCGWMLGSGA